MAHYDIVGNVVIVKFGREVSSAEKKRWAAVFLKTHKQVSTVLEKVAKFGGRLRVQKTKYLIGERTKEALHHENGCVFRLNVDTCYFSPRLSSERQSIANLVKRKESVLVLFGGVAPFAVVIAKTGKPNRVVSVELGRDCTRYAKENVRRNKVEVEVIQGDVRRKLPVMKEKFDRVVMARPNLKDSFLDVVWSKVKKGGIVHYYGFCREDELLDMKNMIIAEAKTAKKKIKIFGVKKAGDIGPYRYRYRIDIKVIV